MAVFLSFILFFFSKNLLIVCSFFHELFFCRKIGDGLKQKRKKEYDTYEGVKIKKYELSKQCCRFLKSRNVL